MAAIGERAGIARKRTLTLAIRELVAKGILTCERRRRQTSVFKWAVLEGAVNAHSKPLECTLSAPIDPVLECTLPVKFQGTLSDQGKVTKEGYQTTYSQNAEKPPRRSAHHPNENDAPTFKDKPKGKSFPQGNQTPSLSLPRTAGEGGKASLTPKATWDGHRLIVPDALLESWRDAYSCVDLDMAINRASSWCLSNPGRRPKKNFSKFLNGWLGRVRPGSPEYIDPEEQAADDAELIRQAAETFPDPDERADFFYQRSVHGLRVPPGVDCRPMPAEKEVAV